MFVVLASARRYCKRCSKSKNIDVQNHHPVWFNRGSRGGLIQRSEVSAPSKIEPVILNALGYGLRIGTKQKVRSDIEQLLPEGHQMVDYDSSKTGKYTPVLHNEHLSKLKMAVVPPNIELDNRVYWQPMFQYCAFTTIRRLWELWHSFVKHVNVNRYFSARRATKVNSN